MLFSSQVFLLGFLPVVLAAYYACAGSSRARQGLVLAASLFFYGWWDPRLLPLLVASVTANWLFAWAALRGSSSVDPGQRRWLLPVGIVFNLALLAVFKYADFFADTLVALGGSSRERWNIVLPLGISFFTFQQISWLVDLRAGRAPRYGFLDYATYVTFFPQLVAGPIVRHNELVPQLVLSPLRDGLYERLSRGLFLLVVGLGKKLFLADGIARVVDPLWAEVGAGAVLAPLEGWVAAVGFGLQIYFDFSGYSDMALGLGLMFGFSLPVNFDRPYLSTSLQVFWRRWHITLSRFLRDHLYIPFGGSRHGPARTAAALMATMLLGGLWHGAGWNFVAWGAVHGAGLATNHLWQRLGRPLPAAVGWTLTMLVVFFAWVLFRAETFSEAWSVWGSMLGLHFQSGSSSVPDGLLLGAIALAVAVIGPSSAAVLEERVPRNRLTAAALGVCATLVVLGAGGRPEEFIYFQF